MNALQYFSALVFLSAPFWFHVFSLNKKVTEEKIILHALRRELVLHQIWLQQIIKDQSEQDSEMTKAFTQLLCTNSTVDIIERLAAPRRARRHDRSDESILKLFERLAAIFRSSQK